MPVAVKHPWDIDIIVPGWKCTTAELEEITGERRETKRYRFKVQALVKQLRKELLERDGVFYVVREEKGAICVFEPDAGGIHLSREVANEHRRMRRFIRELGGLLTFPELRSDIRDRVQDKLTGLLTMQSAERGHRTAIRRQIKAGQTNGSAPMLPGAKD